MTDSWDEMKRAKEEEYFDRQNREALNRLHARAEKQRSSPTSGKAMEPVTIQGVVVDRCPETGGIWLDAEELKRAVSAAKAHSKSSDKEQDDGWFISFFESLFGAKK